MIQVRPVTPGDATAWLGMREALWPDGDIGEHAGEVDQYFAGGLRDPLEVLVAVNESGAPVGFAELSIRTYAEDCETDRVAFLEGWYVAPEARRQGVGRALVAAAEQWARRQGCVEFGSDALLDNSASLAAHLALGFKETEQIRCFKKILGDSSAALDAGEIATILRIEEQLAAAWVAGDRAFIEALLAPDWSVTDAAGQVLTKQEVIDEAFNSSDRQIEAMTIDEVNVRVFGETAVATGRTRARGRYRGEEVSVVLRFTDVFLRRSGGWRIVASHGSVVAQAS